MRTTVVVVGAGQAGLAASHSLGRLGIDHVVLERTGVAHAWRAQRWDSLRLLSPNWMCRLPGAPRQDGDPDGYMTAVEVADLLDRYRDAVDAPVRAPVEVAAVRPGAGGGFRVDTSEGPWWCRSVILATGAAAEPRLPDLHRHLPPAAAQLTSLGYRRPDQVGPGGVLVVGASASGVQIADELARAGRDVTIAVGDHVRVPRTYRGRDIHRWMDALGALDERWDEVPDIDRARRLPSLQLVGTPERRTLDLNALTGVGVRLAGRLVGVAGDRLQLSGSLPALAAGADLKQRRLLDRIDELAAATGTGTEATECPAPTRVGTPPTELGLAGIGTVIWATGYRPRFPWLPDELTDRFGRLRHDGGVLPVPGLYVLGLPFLRRRKSSFLDGVGPDAADIAAHLRGLLDRGEAAA
jgi:putative flavoprotein involved in K+ transport